MVKKRQIVFLQIIKVIKFCGIDFVRDEHISWRCMNMYDVGACLMPTLLSPNELRTRKGILYSRSQLHRKIKAGTFPQPIKLGENRNAWVEDEIDRWINSRIVERNRRLDAQPTA